MKVQYLKRSFGPALACVHTPAGRGASLPPVMFLGGYRSDMTGTKAMFLEQRCAERGQEFLRFDYSGHGVSEGEFSEGTIGSWRQDSIDMFDRFMERPAILVGSSMGGWMALLLALARPGLIKGLIGIAAAPDFTEELFGSLTSDQQKKFWAQGFYDIPGDYSPEPYHFTRAFYEEAKNHLLLGKTHGMRCHMRLLQGKKDRDVPWQTAEKIAAQFRGDVKITYIDDGDHRLSRPQDLEVIDKTLREFAKPNLIYFT